MSQVELFTAAQVLDSGIKIPSPPALLTEMNALLDAPEINIPHVARAIGRDAGATAMLFKLAGSPMFGGRKVPDSVEGVINMLGLTTVADLVRGLMLRSTLSGPPPFYEWFWERSDAIADLAGTLAKNLRGTGISPSQARLAGMFMHCGILLIAQKHADYYTTFQAPGGFAYRWPDVRAANARLNTDHTVVGSLVAKHWKLPSQIAEAILHHHAAQIEDPATGKLVALLQIAAHAYALQHQDEDSGWPEVASQVLERLHLSDDELVDLLDQ